MRFEFGSFTADSGSRQLLRDGVEVHLSPKALDLLVILIQARPRALSKADLHAALWPQTFVSDASLAMLVAEVRAALGESARAPGCLRTVHRHGYAFRATALELAESRPSSVSATGYWLVGSRQIPLVPGENLVGRDPLTEVWLDSASVSRRHARLMVADGRVTLEDLQSKNGTFVQDRPVTVPVALADGDEIRFGSVAVTFRAWTSGVSTRSVQLPP